MTPKEKASRLVADFIKHSRAEKDIKPIQSAKQCALIAVNEIISSSPSLPILGDSGTYGEDIELSNKYWQEVKQEIKNK